MSAVSRCRRYADVLGALEFGGHYDVANEALIEAVKDGLRRIRLVVQRRQGLHNAQRRIDRALALGCSVLVVLTDGEDISNPDAFLRWCTELVTAYKGKQVTWELWNEPGPFTGEPRAFGALMGRAADAIRAIDSSAVIAGCAFHGHDLLDPLGWSRIVLAAPGFPALDALTFHLVKPHQTRAGALADAKAVATYLTSLGARQIIVTEIGYSSLEKFQEPGYLGEAGQALWIADTLPGLLALVDGAYWALLEDLSADYGTNQDFGRNGLFTGFEDVPSRVRKLAWVSFATLLRSTPPRRPRRPRRAA